MRLSTQQQEIESDSDRIEVISVPIYPTGIYTFSEAAELIKCSYSSIRRAVESGNLAITRIGNQPRILGARLLEWIEAGGATGRSKATM
ncbi:MAG: helix-turn-helix domain-containing protein [Blastocatellia bacterium]